MCGLCLAINDNAIDIKRLTESIKHRGPDSTKCYIGPQVRCGFNRLAIVDNNERSDQPMLDDTGRYLLLFNGEIYNHNKLRTELAARHQARFKTRSDTEVLLQGLIFEGTNFLPKLDGIFAFAFVDLTTLEVTLGRDVFGVKPLYYCQQGDRLYVSSEITPLWHMSGSRLDFGNVARYLSYGVVGNGAAIISGVREVPPNTFSVLRSNAVIKTATIRDLVYDGNDGMSLDALRDTLYDTIDSQKPAIRYGVLFSGGLDSTLVLDRCYKDNDFAGAYSVDVVHPDMSERRWQEYVIDALGIGEKYRRVDLRKDHLSVENMAKISEGLDYPLFHPNFVGSYLLTRLASEDGLKVLLSGEGADELFLGYRWFFSEQSPAEYLEYSPFEDLSSVLGVPAAPPMETSGLSKLEIFQKIYLQRWLLRQDMTGMANSVEVRVPFLGLELSDTINRLSFAFKKGTGESKWIIKRLLADRYPKEFIERKKTGFDFPLNDWIGEEHIDFLRSGHEFIDAAALNSILKKYTGSYLRGRIIFSLVSLALWHRKAKYKIRV